MASLITTPTTTTTTTTTTPNFTGIWNETVREGLDSFLSAMGIGWIKRKAAAALISKQTHIILMDNNEPTTIVIRQLGGKNGPEENILNIGSPTIIPSKDQVGQVIELKLNLRWNEKQDILLNDLITEVGAMHVKRSMVGEQMKVEVFHTESQVSMYRLFTKEIGSDMFISMEDGKVKVVKK